jgi:hypothetical protein
MRRTRLVHSSCGECSEVMGGQVLAFPWSRLGGARVRARRRGVRRRARRRPRRLGGGDRETFAALTQRLPGPPAASIAALDGEAGRCRGHERRQRSRAGLLEPLELSPL